MADAESAQHVVFDEHGHAVAPTGTVKGLRSSRSRPTVAPRRTDDGYLVRLRHAASDHVEFGDTVRIAITPTPVTVRQRSAGDEDDLDE